MYDSASSRDAGDAGVFGADGGEPATFAAAGPGTAKATAGLAVGTPVVGDALGGDPVVVDVLVGDVLVGDALGVDCRLSGVDGPAVAPNTRSWAQPPPIPCGRFVFLLMSTLQTNSFSSATSTSNVSGQFFFCGFSGVGHTVYLQCTVCNCNCRCQMSNVRAMGAFTRRAKIRGVGGKARHVVGWVDFESGVGQ